MSHTNEQLNTTSDTKRVVHFVQHTVKEDGEFLTCLAEEGTLGYHKTDWPLGTDFKEAVKICNERNEEMGISKEDALMIQISTMRQP